MRNNFIRSLPDLSGLPRLELLDLQNNLIQRAAQIIPHKLIFLSLDNNPPGSLPKIRLGQSLTVLKIGRNRIESLLGFGDTDALEILVLSNNSLQDVSHMPIMDGLKYVTLSHCNLHGTLEVNKTIFPSLVYLNIAYNDITNISVLETARPDGVRQDYAVIDSVFILKLNGNKLSDLNFLKSFPNIRTLEMNENDILAFNRHNPTSFQQLQLVLVYLEHNKISDVERFRNLTHLQIISLSDNYIAYVSPTAFLGCTNLRILRMNDNRLNKLPALSQCLNLISLHVRNNEIQEVFLNDLEFKFLTSIDLSSNGLTNITLNGSLALTQILLHNKNLSTFDILDTSNLPRLSIVNISYNQISNLNTREFNTNKAIKCIFDDNLLPVLVLPYSSNVRFLYARKNRIENLTRIVPSAQHPMTNAITDHLACRIKDLFLDSNSISFLPSIIFESCDQLMTLSLSDNPISVVEMSVFLNLPQLVSLAISHTLILYTPFEQLLSRKGRNMFHSLYMDNVTLFHRRDASNEPLNLKLALDRELFLRYNSFITIPSIKAMYVVELDLSFNDINLLERDSFKLTPRISYLNLNGNAITSIQMHALRFNVHLVLVNLEDNHLQVIGHEALVKMGRFDLLLGNNDLVNISPLTLPEVSRSISFDPNPWRCDCSLRPLYRWYMRSNENTLNCWTPIHLRGRTLATLTDEELCPLIRNVSNEKDISGEEAPDIVSNGVKKLELK